MTMNEQLHPAYPFDEADDLLPSYDEGTGEGESLREYSERIAGGVKHTAEYAEALAARADRWVPACGGHEEPFTHEGERWLYVWNPSTMEHGYLNLGTDIVHDEAPWD